LSITALGFIAVYGVGLILALWQHPIFGLLTYLWAFYNHPPGRWWGSGLPDLRWSLLAALVTLIAITLRKSDSARPPWYKNWGAGILICFASWMWIQTTWAINPSHSEGALLFSKYVLLFYVIYQVLCDEKTIEFFSWGHVVGCFIFGWMAFRDPVIGRLETVGGPGVDDANVLGAHLLTGIAFAGFMFLSTPGKRRWILLAAIPFVLNAIILTRSRGAFIGLLAAGFAAWYLTPRTHRRLLYIVAPLALLLLQRVADSSFWERMDTISVRSSTEIEDFSARTRIEVLKANIKMFQDYPMGVGYRGNVFLSPKYLDPEFLVRDIDLRAAHNTLMAILVDHGIPGAIMFAILAIWVAYTLWRLKSLDSLQLSPLLGTYRAAIGTSLAGLLVSGQFLNLLTAEVQIWMIAMLAALNSLYQRSLVGHEESKLSGPNSSRSHESPTPSVRSLPRSPSTNYNLRRLAHDPIEMLPEAALVLDVGCKNTRGKYAVSAGRHVVIKCAGRAFNS
jgi:hypothetical protein